MNSTEMSAESMARDVARECLYRFLAIALSDPQNLNWAFMLEPDVQHWARQATNLLRELTRGVKESLGFGELPSEQLDLGELLAELQKPRAELQEEYDRVFGLVLNRECPPYETEYHPNVETFFRAQQLADIAGFYYAFGIVPGRAAPERPDHLALELEFMAFLLLKKRLALAELAANPNASEQAQICDEAQESSSVTISRGGRHPSRPGCGGRQGAAFMPPWLRYWPLSCLRNVPIGVFPPRGCR